jgi:amino acid adenylation domain-containing protein
VADPRVEIAPDDIAYISFTSGSTGTPKGVLGRHIALTLFANWTQKEFAISEQDRFSMLSGLAHDPLQRDIFTPLQLGASLSIPDPKEIGTPGWLARWMKQEGISVTNLSPAMGHMLTDTAGDDELPCLRHAFFVGDKLTRRDVARLKKLAPTVTSINLYGTTETQRAVSFFVAEHEAVTTTKEELPVGRGIDGVQLLVLNAAGQLAGIGELGEIYFRSPYLALGYNEDDELTQQRFITNPFTGVQDDRLYKTGDIGRYLPDGNVEMSGRMDHQVKIRGFRIELGEIESAIGIEQLKRLDQMQQRRRAIVEQYDEAFAGIKEIERPVERPHVQSAWHIYALRLRLESLTIDRARFIEELRQLNIGASVHFIPVHLHAYHRKRYGYQPEDFPVALREYERMVSIPLSPKLEEADVADVIEAVKDVVTKHRR